MIGVFAASAYYVWGRDACYTFLTISIPSGISQEDRDLAQNVRHEATTKVFCGPYQYSPVLTLEDLAKRGAVTQVAFQWLEPAGWTEEHRDMLDVLNQKDIKAETIIEHASAYVHESRLRYVAWYILAAIAVSLLSLGAGVGVAWVRRGFKNAK